MADFARMPPTRRSREGGSPGLRRADELGALALWPSLRGCHQLVAPAKAGAQSGTDSEGWTPAFAGVTSLGALALWLSLRGCPQLVAPAKAGAHPEPIADGWTPAFAGVTSWGQESPG